MEELYVYETRKKAYGRGEYQVRRKAKRVKCWDCEEEWLIRADRKSPQFCRECGVKNERNPMFGKTPWNKNKKSDFNRKEYNRNYVNQLRWDKKKKLIHIMGNQCWKCGDKNLPICVWQWHHLDPNLKVKALSQMLVKSWENLLDEAKKCVLVCSNCHKILHYGEERLDAIKD
jgi:hypothetical protein